MKIANPFANAMSASAGRSYVPFLVAPAIAFACCFLAKDYQLFQLTVVFSYALSLLGLTMLTGCNGQISLGHGAFYAVGAYVAAIAMSQFAVPYWLAVLLAGFVCLIVGYLFGLPALKLEGLYLSLATFALAVVLPLLLKHKALEPWTGGVEGITLEKPNAPWGLPLSADQWLYLFALAVTTLGFVVAARLLASDVGRTIVAIRDNPIASACIGIDNRRFKASVFAVSALYTGLGGALSAIAVQFVAPDSFSMFLSISLLVGIVVGGVGTLSGAIYGAFFIMFVPSAAESISKAAPWAIYGVILIGSIFVAPEGVAGLIDRLAERFRAVAPTRGAAISREARKSPYSAPGEAPRS